jgi:hypothetical protein
MKPAPITTARRAAAAPSRNAMLWSNERSTWMPASSGNDGMRFGTSPVAITSSSYCSVVRSSSVTVWVTVSSDRTAEPSISAMSFCR